MGRGGSDHAFPLGEPVVGVVTHPLRQLRHANLALRKFHTGNHGLAHAVVGRSQTTNGGNNLDHSNYSLKANPSPLPLE